MEQSNQQSPPAQPQSSGQRDMMYCHECHDEWYRDEHGLTCPECGSDFTEIIEAEHDPRAEEEMPDLEDEHEPEHFMPPPPALHQLLHHHPWRDAPDPEEPDINNFSFRQTGPGTFALTGTIYRSYSPSGRVTTGGGGGAPNPLLNNFASMLNGIIGGGRAGGAQGQGQGQGQAQNQGINQNEQNGGGQPAPGGDSRRREGITPGGHRFHYTQTARLLPRGDGQGPRLEPVDGLQDVLAGLMAVMGEAPGGRQAGQTGQTEGDQQHPHAPINPFAALLSLLNPGNAVHGDAVYSQEAFDRIISQLMEQNASGTAPGPASQDAIKSLPKKHVSVEMLGPEGKAECSICMDEVNIGEEVTELPCHHWFHDQCVSAWLGEHDTCPHCRKGITPKDQANNPANPSTAPGTGATSSGTSSNPAQQIPGSFTVSGEGTPQHPYMVDEDLPGRVRPEQAIPNQGHSRSGSAHSDHSGGSIGDRIRRSIFGSPR